MRNLNKIFLGSLMLFLPFTPLQQVMAEASETKTEATTKAETKAKTEVKAKAEAKVKTETKTIYWESLVPPVDSTIMDRYEKGTISPEEVSKYVTQLGNTPVKELDKARVRIPGYLVPLDMNNKQVATELLFVPTLGACVHVPPPPPNQTIYVTYNKGIKVTEAGYTPYWLEGTLSVSKTETTLAESLYTMSDTKIEEYK